MPLEIPELGKQFFATGNFVFGDVPISDEHENSAVRANLAVNEKLLKLPAPLSGTKIVFLPRLNHTAERGPDLRSRVLGKAIGKNSRKNSPVRMKNPREQNF